MKLSKKAINETISMIREFFADYRSYKKWNYNNPKVNTFGASQAKILRQTHIIEKGLSLSNPRIGFGIPKIKDLFLMLDDYIANGYSTEAIPFQNALEVLRAYKEYQSEKGFENKEIYEKINSYMNYYNDRLTGGIKSEKLLDLKKVINAEFPVFFSNRHSIRQFSDKPIELHDIEDAVRIAQKAPSACNRQATKVYYYRDKETNDRLGELIAGNTGFEGEVGAYLVLTGDMSAFYDAFERNQLYVEGGMFAMALIESLHYKGIASCALQNGEISNKNEKFKAICKNIPENERIILFIAIGYYKEEYTYAVSNRKDLNSVLIIK